MKTALILGITGGFGSNVANALLANGWRVKALVRSAENVAHSLSQVEIVVGDATDSSALSQAANGVDAIVYGINMPYRDWQEKARPLLEITVKIAEQKRLLIVFPANVYVFDPKQGPEFDESANAQPISKKGKVRALMERRLLRASQQGARVLVMRSGDFIGANASNSWLGQLLVKAKAGYTLLDPSTSGHVHSWACLGDLAEVTVDLMNLNSQQEAFEVFHFAGYQLTMNDIKTAIANVSGQSVTLKPFPWWLARLAAPFTKAAREMLEMQYLWEQEVKLKQQKLALTLDKKLVQTPLSEALTKTGLFD